LLKSIHKQDCLPVKVIRLRPPPLEPQLPVQVQPAGIEDAAAPDNQSASVITNVVATKYDASLEDQAESQSFPFNDE
jgi:hypothetical protein